MNIVISAIRSLASLRNINKNIRDEALRLAADATPRIGRSGWAQAQAEGLLARAEANLLQAATVAARELEVRAEEARLARHVKAREALEWAGKAAGGFCLVDTGRYGHGGHWPHWSVTPGAGGWASLEEAENEAKARNARVSARWAEYIS
jgi:hypothetical protein